MKVVFRTYTKKDGTPDYGYWAVLQHLEGLKEKDILVRIDIDKKQNLGYDEVDIFCPSLKISHLELKQLDGSKFEATFDTKNLRAVFQVLLNMGKAGNGGHCFEMLIGNKSFCIDGDGNDILESINDVSLRNIKIENRHDWADIYNKDIEKNTQDMKNNTVKLNEAQMRETVEKAVRQMLQEYHPNTKKDPMKQWFKDMDDAQKVRDTMDYITKGSKNPAVNESQLRNIIAKTVKAVLNESLLPVSVNGIVAENGEQRMAMTPERFRGALQKRFYEQLLSLFKDCVKDFCASEKGKSQDWISMCYEYAENDADITADEWTRGAMKLLNSNDWHYPQNNFRPLDFVMGREHNVHNFQELLSQPKPVDIFLSWFWESHGTYGVEYNFRNDLADYMYEDEEEK